MEIDSNCIRDLIIAVNDIESGSYQNVWDHPVLASYAKEIIVESAQFLLAIYKS